MIHSTTLFTAIFSIVALFAASCVSTSSTRLGSKTYPPTAAAQVVIHSSAATVGRPFEEIALIKASGDDEFTDESEMLEALKKEAANLGAHAIILGEGIQDPSAGDKLVGELMETGAERTGKVIAIRYTDDQAS